MYNDIRSRITEMNVGIEELKSFGIEHAQAKCAYETAKYQIALKMRSKDMPVTLINQILRGHPDVSMKRLERDIAEINLKACQESINILKYDIRSLQDEYNKEWGATKYGT